MKTRLLLLVALVMGSFIVNAQVQQDPETLKAERAKQVAAISAAQGEIDKIDGILARLDVTGWDFGGSGSANFSANGNNNWVAIASETDPLTGLPYAGSSVVQTVTNVDVFANYQQPRFFWFNGLSLLQNFNINLPSGILEGTGAPEIGDLINRTSDKLYFQSVPGYRINSELAASGLFDLESSLGQFLNPGTFSAGLGLTWTPTKFADGRLKPLRVIFHPLTWKGTIVNETEIDNDRKIFQQALRNELGLFGDETLISQFGLKFVADYARTLKILGNNISWKTQLRGFAPYTQLEPILSDATTGLPLLNADGTPQIGPATGPMELNWDNNFSILIFKNIALGANYNLRSYKPEYDGVQSLWNAGFGLNTTF